MIDQSDIAPRAAASGAVSLSDLVAREALSPSAAASLALQLAQALEGLHCAGQVHGRVSPATIMVETSPSAHGIPHLADAQAFDSVPQALAYASPEQTGRTGRPVDARSDLYSLGVTLYELITGRKPFDSDDPLQLVRSHLADVPPSPATLKPGLPRALSDIVMRLLEKDPDKRYQNARGLAHDLAHLIETAHPDGHGFELGRYDFPETLVPSELVGRARETEALMHALREAVDGRCRGVLVTGGPGVGKTALIHALRPQVAQRGGWFVSTKFDQYGHGPLAVEDALRSLGRLLLAEPEDQLALVRERLSRGLAGNLGFGPTSLREFVLLLGEHAAVQPTRPRDVEARLVQTMLALLRSVATPQRPLVVFFDDVQWAPSPVLRLLDAAMSDAARCPGLLLVAAYRASEVDAAHPLTPMLHRWQTQGPAVTTLPLSNLHADDLRTMVARLLRVAPDAAAELSAVLTEYAEGNPFETVELLNLLRRAGGLTLRQGRWSWNAADIRRHIGLSDVVQLIGRRLAQLPPPTRDLLDKLACLGGDIDMALLAQVAGSDASSAMTLLKPAFDDGLLVLQPGITPVVRLRHDRVQQALVQGIGHERSGPLHLSLARRLAARPEFEAKAAEHYLLALESLRQSGEAAELRYVQRLFRRVASRLDVANMAAAEQLLKAATVIHVDAGSPDDEQGLEALDVHLHRVLCGLGRLEEADAVYGCIVARHTDPLALIEPAGVQLLSLDDRGRSADTLAMGFALLDRLGMPRPPDLDAALQAALEQVGRWLAGDAKEADFTRPLIEDRKVLAWAKVLSRIVYAAAQNDPKLFAWVTLQACRLWIDHGPSPELAAGVATVPYVLGVGQQNYRGGYLGSRHFLAVAEQRGFGLGTAQLRLLFAASAGHWVDPIEELVADHRLAREELMRSGDFHNASISYLLANILLDGADTLEPALRDLEAGLALARRMGSEVNILRWHVRRQMIKALCGQTREFTGLSDESFDEALFVQRCAGDLSPHRHLVISYHAVKFTLGFVFGDTATLHEHAEGAQRFVDMFPGFYVAVNYRVLLAVDKVRQARNAAGAERAAHLHEARRTHAWLKARASDAPANFGHLQRWLEAELHWAEDEPWAAHAGFNAALEEAQRHHRPLHRALITEQAGRFERAHGVDLQGRALLARAREAYEALGAAGKVRALEDEFDFLRSESVPADGPSAYRRTDSAAESIDLAAVLRASQALSSETQFPRLASRLAHILGAMTGATGVQLLLRHGQGDWVPSTGVETAQAGVDVEHEVADPVPWSVVRYVERTRETLLLDDATHDARFSGDPYFNAFAPCSMLVVPVSGQGELSGLLLLENRHARGAFNSERLATVSHIVGQLAVSMDNAWLYGSLEKKVAERTAALARANDELQSMISLREGELRATNVLKAAIVDNSFEAIVTTDAAGRIVEFNPAAEGVFGRSRDDAIGMPYEHLFPQRHRTLQSEWLAQFGQGGTSRLLGRRETMTALRADGTEFPVEAVLWRTELDGVVHCTASMRDITEQLRNAQLIERQRDELRQSERLTLMGSLLAGVAHELNNPLSVVTGAATMLEERSAGTPSAALAQRIREAAMRCGKIVRTFLNMARQRKPARSQVQVNAVVEAAADMLAYMLRTHEVEVVLDLAPDLASVNADADQLAQIVLNLIVNAQQAMATSPAPRRLVLSTGFRAPVDDSPGAVWLRVADTGPGVPEALAETIFVPFFTTKAEGTGTGLGLAMCRTIAREHGGDVVLEPSAAGASFLVTLPLTAPDGIDEPAPQAPRAERRLTGTRVLVVDDEPELADVMRAMLESADADVAVAESGEVALEMLEAAGFDVIVCDIRMPGMSGLELWRLLRARSPALAQRMLFVTGDTLSPDVARFLADSGCAALMKPFTSAELLDRVLAVLKDASM